MDGMQAEEKSCQPGNPSVPGELEGEKVDQASRGKMRENGGQMPAPGVKPKCGVVQTQPGQEERPVIVRQKVRVVESPNVGREIRRKIPPGPYGIVGDNQHVVVKNESQDQRIRVRQKRHREDGYGNER